MTVSLNFSTVAGAAGTPIGLPQTGGTISPGATSSEMDIYISHDGSNEITEVKFYMLPYSAGVYPGTTTAQDDYNTLIGWADASYASDPTAGGGVYINMDLAGGHLAADYQSFRTGVGDTLANAITLVPDAVNITAGYGIIPAGAYAHVKFRIDVPSSYLTAGTLYFDILATYTATS